MAKAAGCHVSTIVKIEKEAAVNEKTRMDVVRALEQAGITFVPAEGSMGAGVRWTTRDGQNTVVHDKKQREEARRQEKREAKSNPASKTRGRKDTTK